MLLTRYKGPGCYRFLDTLENVIYVGSAKNIDRRLRSHFNGKQGHLGKEVYNQVARVEICKCEDYPSALALEQFLINKYKPRYNKKDKDHNINSKVVSNNEFYENIEAWEVYYKLRSLDKEKIDLTKKQDRALVVVAYSMFILLILKMIL
mgnify:FL=1